MRAGLVSSQAVAIAPGRKANAWTAAGLAAVGGLAAATAANARFGLALTLVLLVGVALVRRVSVLLVVLAGSVFTEAVTVGSVNISRVLGPVALFAVVLALLQGDWRLPMARPVPWIVAYVLWAITSGFWSTDFGGTLFLLGSLGIALAYMVAFATFVSREDQLYRLLRVVSVIALVISIYAIADFVRGGGRSSGGVGDPNSLAAGELIFLPLVLAVAIEARSTRARLGLYGALLAIVGAVMTTLSRGGLVTLVVVAVAVALAPARAFFRSPAQKLALLAALLACATIAFSATSSAFAPRLHEIFTQSGETGSGRLNLWRAAVTSIREHPVLGVGFGAFPGASVGLVERTPGVDLVNWEPPTSGEPAHSAYLETLAEIGIPGLVIFLGILGATGAELVASARLARRARNPGLARVANGLLLGLVAWVSSALFLSQETARPLWVAIGLSLAVSALAKRAAAVAARESPSRTDIA